jgi:flavorubredoxin
MTITNPQSGTSVNEIADGIFRISTPVVLPGDAGAFSFNKYLIVDDEPLLFNTGLRALFPMVREAVGYVMPVAELRHIAFSHVEADECGALNPWLAVAPQAAPLCGNIAAMISIGDIADRPPRGLADGELVNLGRHRVVWLDAPHLPHAWECGYLHEQSTGTLLCGDLFTQPGDGRSALTEDDILGPSEAFRHAMDYFSHTRHAGALVEKLAQTRPTTLACMHGSAWRGDGATLLRALATALDA